MNAAGGVWDLDLNLLTADADLKDTAHWLPILSGPPSSPPRPVFC